MKRSNRASALKMNMASVGPIRTLWVALGVSAGLAVAGAARAQTCAAYPNTLTNGTTADANQVMANFNCAARLGGASFTGPVNVSATGTSVPLNVSSSSTSVAAMNVFVPGGSAIALALASVSGGTLYMAPNTASGNWNPLVQSGDDVIVYSAGSVGTGALSLVPWSSTQSGLRMTSTGAVGIGTAAPAYLFNVNGSAGGTSAWNIVSDARLKTNVTPITGALERIEQLRGVTFNWKAPDDRAIGKGLSLPVGEKQIGFIAQEVAAIAPEAVTIPKDPSKDIYAIRDGALTPLLVEAIKAQQAEIDDLRTQVAALKAAR